MGSLKKRSFRLIDGRSASNERGSRHQRHTEVVVVAVMGKEQEEQEEEQEEGKEPNAQSATLTPHSHFDRRNFEPKSTNKIQIRPP